MTAEEFVKQKYPSARADSFTLNGKLVCYVKMAGAKEVICTDSTISKAWDKAKKIIKEKGFL